MSERNIASGSDFMVFFVEGTELSPTYRPIAGQTNCTLTREPNYRETNNKNLGGYKDYFKGLKGWSATVDVDIPDPSDVDAGEVSYEELEDWDEAGTKKKVLFTHVTAISTTADDVTPDTTRPSYEGWVLINAPRNAPSGENQTSSVALQGCRKLTKIAAVPET